MTLNANITIIDSTVIREIPRKYLPFSDLGLGWLCPAAVGFAIGLTMNLVSRRKIKN